MRQALVALVALVACAGCARSQTTITLNYELRDESGAPLSCRDLQDLGCVNFVRFQLSRQGGSDMLTHCIKVDRSLATLCDLETVALGTELFSGEPDDIIVITMQGLRAFPAETCELTAACPPRELFSGIAGPRRLGDLVGGTLVMNVTRCGACGAAEEFRARASGATCAATCASDALVCPPPGSGLEDVQGGCLCRTAAVGAAGP